METWGTDTIPGQFDAVVERNADRIAITYQGSATTYRELQRLADSLALRLRAAGVSAETVVGVCCDRSIDYIVCILGVLKAGGAYVTLPPGDPLERVRHLVMDSRAIAIVAGPGHEQAAAGFGLPVISAAGGRPAHPTEAAALEAPCFAGPDALAYVIYTSGTTGRPKGVGVSHRNLLGLVGDRSYARFGPSETFLQLSPPAFDASAFEIWGALLSGARLVIPRASYHALDELPEVLQSEQVSMLLLTPPLFHELIRNRISAFRSVRRLIVGAEAMSVATARTYLAEATARQATFANVYGPTEATTLVSCFEITDLDGDGAAIPIGSPIDTARLYLLDDRLRPVPKGAIGQIHIGGSCVTRGYLGQPGLTASCYIPDPFIGSPGARMYATGDLGRLRDDGEIEFAGRRDDQVKIRGHRVELGEVEATISAYPGVLSNAVTYRKTSVGSGQLVAHVVPRQPGNPRLAADLASFIGDRLPPHMQPTQVRLVTALPLTPSGKLDRKALAESHDLPAREVDPVRPARTRREAILTDVWLNVLGLDRLELDDDFFALGGDSLLAIRVVADAEAQGEKMSLAELFGTPTIRALSTASTDRAGSSDPGATMNASDQERRHLADGIEASFPASLMQLGILFESEARQDAGLYVDVISRRVAGEFDETLLREALQYTIDRHPALRTSFDLAAAGEPMQLVHRSGHVDLVVLDHRRRSESEVLEAIKEGVATAGLPFAADVGPLIRFLVIRITDEEYQLIYGFHHAVVDGWSESVLAGDLLGTYDRLLRGGQPAHDETNTLNATFVDLEQRALASPETQRYWRERCATLRPLLIGSQSGGEAPRRRTVKAASRDVARGLRLVSRELKIPYKSLVLAAHLGAIGCSFDSPEPVTGLVVNGRPEVPGADRAVGLFLNVVPASADIASSWSDIARSLFAQEKETLLHRRYPYPALIELADGRTLFDTVFNYVHFHLDDELRRLERVKIVDTRIVDTTSFPLGFDVVHSPDGDQLAVEVAADGRRVSESDLDSIAEAHIEALKTLVSDPHARPVMPRV